MAGRVSLLHLVVRLFRSLAIRRSPLGRSLLLCRSVVAVVRPSPRSSDSRYPTSCRDRPAACYPAGFDLPPCLICKAQLSSKTKKLPYHAIHKFVVVGGEVKTPGGGFFFSSSRCVRSADHVLLSTMYSRPLVRFPCVPIIFHGSSMLRIGLGYIKATPLGAACRLSPAVSVSRIGKLGLLVADGSEKLPR